MYQKIRQYFKGREANSRFENTDPFELDPKIRIAYDAKDLVVIHHPEVKAVLWKRDISPKISEDICQYEADQGARKHGQQVAKNLNGVDILYDNSTPDSIAHDVADVNKSFNRATYSSENAHIKYFHGSTDSKQEDRASMVHVDDNFTLRALACYSLDINAATQYYPGDFSREDIKRINQELNAVSTSEERDVIKEKYYVQTLALGEVLVTKGLNYDPSLGAEGQLLHNGSERYEGGIFRYLTM